MNPGRLCRLCRRAVVAGVLCAAGASPLGAQAVLETFEADVAGWQVTVETAGDAAVARSTARAASGSASARVTTASAGARAALRTSFTDVATVHVWQERPGTHRWQRARVYVPGATIAALGASGAATLARFWASGDPDSGWALRVRQGGALSAIGRHHDSGATIEFPIYAAWPADQWVELEIGLHSQAGPGVKRAFAVVVNGQFHGWYHQGWMREETYDRVAIGLVDATTSAALEAFVDDWGTAGTAAFPTGTDLRPTAALQEQDYRTLSGVQWQIDWSTWGNDLRLDPVHGLYSNTSRLQSGRNLDRMPPLESGWAEIEVGWPHGQPPLQPSGYFGPMVGFRKEINREQNLEIIPIGTGGGNVDLVLEAWNERELILARWPMPTASIGGQSSAVPQPGDVIRARWQQSGSSLRIRASFYDASATTWHTDVIDTTVVLTNLHGVDFADGYHLASSITTDSPYYGIRRFRVGTDATFPGSQTCTYALSPGAASVGAAGGSGVVTVTTAAGCAWSAASTAGWLAVSGGGTGSGAASWTAAANAGAPRAAAVTVGGQSMAITQDAAVLPSLSVGDVVVAEHTAGIVTARFPVWLSAPVPQTVTVQYATANGSALAGSDYTATSGTLALPPGDTAGSVAVDVLPGPASEAAETFELRLDGAAHATIADGSGTATILPGGAFTVQPPEDLAVVAMAAGTFTLRWRAPPTGPAPTGFLLTGGTAPGESLAGLPLGAGHRLVTVSLPPGIYYVRLQSLAGNTLSLASNELRVVLDASTPPSAPFGLTGLVDGSGVALGWRRTFAGGIPEGARLEVGGAASVVLPLAAAETFTFPSVPPGTYTFTVRAANAAGGGASSNAVTLSFPGPCTGPPQPPGRLVAHRDGRTLALQWDPAPTGPAATGYLLVVSGSVAAVLPTAARALGGTVGPGTYGFSVVATNSCGQSAATAVETVTVS